jgi:hypothetical protein
LRARPRAAVGDAGGLLLAVGGAQRGAVDRHGRALPLVSGAIKRRLASHSSSLRGTAGPAASQSGAYCPGLLRYARNDET